MIVDIVKLFPQACAKQGIQELFADTAKLTEYGYDLDCKPTVYFVKIENVMYRFTSVNDGHFDDDGITHLASIDTAEWILASYSEKLSQGLQENQEMIEGIVHSVTKRLDRYKLLYGA